VKGVLKGVSKVSSLKGREIMRALAGLPES